MPSKKTYLAFKRVFDIAFSAILLCTVLVWLIPLLALIIRLSTPGNPIFVQERVGKNRKVFRCYKLRTMRLNPGPEIMAEGADARITRLGRVLRYSGLDELPQFINVLMGHMSVVGPRPHMLTDDKVFEHEIPEYGRRHVVRPGVTGLAQIKGFKGQIRGTSELKARLGYDLYYIMKMNPALDLYIIFRSMADMFRGMRNAC